MWMSMLATLNVYTVRKNVYTVRKNVYLVMTFFAMNVFRLHPNLFHQIR